MVLDSLRLMFYFDDHVVDTDAPSLYTTLLATDFLHSAGTDKRLVWLVMHALDGMPGNEAGHISTFFAVCLSAEWERRYSAVASCVQSRLSFVVLRPTMLCVRVHKRGGDLLGFWIVHLLNRPKHSFVLIAFFVLCCISHCVVCFVSLLLVVVI